MVKTYQGSPSDAHCPHRIGRPQKRPVHPNATSVILYQPISEVVPLLPKPKRRETTMTLMLCIGGMLFLLFAFVAYHAGMHFLRCPPDPFTRDALRRDWELEAAHQERLRQEWTRERIQHEWERERWQRESEERERREEEERLRRHLFWGNLQAHACTTYATRAYTAQLMNLPIDWRHRVEACKATPLEIHGVSYLPKTCEDKGPGIVIGRWEIDQQEPDCTTFWDLYHDNGCSSPGSGKKYITHKLENLPDKSNWREFCATTPARFNNMQFPGAQECFTSIWGVFGQWEIEDDNCT